MRKIKIFYNPRPSYNLMVLQSHPPLTILQSYNLRPDLLDWRQVERRDVRERIDLAFHIMDREYGVTRLLDPEGKQRFTVLDCSSARMYLTM